MPPSTRAPALRRRRATAGAVMMRPRRAHVLVLAHVMYACLFLLHWPQSHAIICCATLILGNQSEHDTFIFPSSAGIKYNDFTVRLPLSFIPCLSSLSSPLPRDIYWVKTRVITRLHSLRSSRRLVSSLTNLSVGEFHWRVCGKVHVRTFSEQVLALRSCGENGRAQLGSWKFICKCTSDIPCSWTIYLSIAVSPDDPPMRAGSNLPS